jgi:hypothetical protein
MNIEHENIWPHCHKTDQRTIQYRFLEKNFEIIHCFEIVNRQKKS